ncbi:MAG TPA: MBL fold metallo-hydrolase [Gammaproteobacteria bacterium]|nr:MBL fold metallo-hydrolase [Gammaproteobacteria bacterium]
MHSASAVSIRFLGAARQVTGSCFLFETPHARFIVDCGMFQGGQEARALNRRDFGFDPKALDFVLLTHAHIDHSGLLPRLWAFGFRGPIYATAATVDLAAVMLADSAHIQESDWMRAERRLGRAGRKKQGRLTREDYPLYTVAHAEACSALFEGVQYDEYFAPAPGIRCRLRDAGHILGSAIVELWIEGPRGTRKIVCSGDLGQPGRPIVRDPTPIAEADVLLVESTYGNREHKDLTATIEELHAVLTDTVTRRRGNVVVPAFALGRTQELLYVLMGLQRAGRLPKLRIFVDSPLALRATEITLRHPEFLDEDTRALLAHGRATPRALPLQFTESVEDSMTINEIDHGALIIAASGMCDAGRIRHHLHYNLPRAECAIVIIGYQAEGTLGRRLVDRASQVRLFGEDVPVRASIHTIGGLSAHADRRALLAWLSGFERPPERTFVVHGEARIAQDFAALVARERHWKHVEAPVQNAVYTL